MYPSDISRAREALMSIPPDLPYGEWFDAGCGAIASGLSIDDIDAWSSPGKTYKGRAHIEAIFRNVTPDGGTGPGTLFHLAKQYGYKETGKRRSSLLSPTSKNYPPRPVLSPCEILADIAANCEPATVEHPYIQKKLGLHEELLVYKGIKTIRRFDCYGALVLPLSDLDSNVIAVQFIPLIGEKVYPRGTKLSPEACLVIGGPLLHAKKAFIVEGIGQAWTAHQTTRTPAVVCFGKGRMAGVAKAIHDRYPNLLLVIVPDAGGQQEAAKVAQVVGGLYVDVPADWSPNYDINDFHKESGSLEAIATLLDSAKAPEIIEKKVEILGRGNTLNDSGNAARLVKLFGQDIRWLPSIKKWMVWNGHSWLLDEDGAIDRIATATAVSIHEEARKERDADKGRNIAKWACTSLSLPRLKAMIELAKAELNISIPMSALDQNDMLLGTPSGVVDLTTGMLSEANHFDYITRTISARFELAATCPNWEKFLERCFAGNRRVIEFIQRAVGYCLTGSTQEQVMFLLFGKGCNGKSVFLETIRQVMGIYAMHTQAETLMQRTGERASNDIARLKGARMVSAIEAENDGRLAESLIKQLTGGDLISARFLYGEFFEFKPTFKIWLATNHKPRIRGNDYGIWRRLCLIPFLVRIPEEEQDKQLAPKLAAEAAGILQWAIRGALEWQRIGLCPPPEVKEATQQYQRDMDVFHNWLDECCEIGLKKEARAGAVIKNHLNWAEHMRRSPLSQRELSKKLQDHGFRKHEDRNGIKYIGLSLV